LVVSLLEIRSVLHIRICIMSDITINLCMRGLLSDIVFDNYLFAFSGVLVVL